MSLLPVHTNVSNATKPRRLSLSVLILIIISLLSILTVALAIGLTSARPARTSNPTASKAINVRVISHNLRFAGNSTSGFYPNENAWAPANVPDQARYRAPDSAAQLKKWSSSTNGTFTFICLQEALFQQVRDLVSGLNGGPVPYGGDTKTFHVVGEQTNSQDYSGSLGRTDYKLGNADINDAGLEWSYLGVGRDDGQSQGEMSPILYKPSDWSVITWRTMWLSETPTKPSYGFGAGNRRIATWAIFESRTPDKTRIVVCSAHLDDNYWDQNDSIRANELALINSAVEAYVGRSSKIVPRGTYGYPVVIGADFNANSSAPSVQSFAKGSLNFDLNNNLRKSSQAWGPVNTYTTFGTEWHPDNIDYLWCTPWSKDGGKTKNGMGSGKAYWSIASSTRFGVVSDREGGSPYNSDHDMVLSDLTLSLN